MSLFKDTEIEELKEENKRIRRTITEARRGYRFLLWSFQAITNQIIPYVITPARHIGYNYIWPISH